MKSLFFAALLVACTLCSCAPNTAQKELVGVNEWIVVPVFYATNRTFAGNDSSIAYADEPNNTGLLFGVKNVVVPFPKDLTLTEDELHKLSWQSVRSDVGQEGVPPVVAASQCSIKDGLLTKEQIIKEFQAYSKQTGTDDSVMFVHGCCANFDTSMKRAAKLAINMGDPVLLYDWVSPVGFKNYLVNATRVKQTVDDFCKFLANVEKIVDPNKITLLGHSMGAQFIDEALVRRSASVIPLKRFHEVIMSNADVDAESFLKHASDFVANASTVRIYISKTDECLKASAFAHGNFVRLGCPSVLANQLAKVKGVTVVDITEAKTAHEIPFFVVGMVHNNDWDGLKKQFAVDTSSSGYILHKQSSEGSHN